MRSRAAHPQDLLGVTEIAGLLNCPKQSVTGYIDSKRAGFPEPWARLRMGPIWLRDDINQWIRHREETNGRPATRNLA